MDSITNRFLRQTVIPIAAALWGAGAAAAGEVSTATPTPTATETMRSPTPSLRPISISCSIVLDPPEPHVGEEVFVSINRDSTGLGYPGYEFSGGPGFSVPSRVPPSSSTFRVMALEEGATRLSGSTVDEFIVGYSDGQPYFSFYSANCSLDVTVGPALTATPTRPSPTPTQTQPTTTPTFTPTSCVSDLPTVEEIVRTGGLRRTLSGFNRGLYCFRGGSISIEGALVEDITINCGTGRYTADIVLSRADATTEVRVCHHPGTCGSTGCRAIQLEHSSARTFIIDTNGDATDQSPGDGSCATAGGLCTLRAAVQEANAHGNDDTTSIRLTSGTHALELNTGDDDSPATGDLDVRSEISVTGTSGSVIDGSMDALAPATQRVFEIHGEGILLLADMTVRGGHGWQGGGVGNSGAVALERVTLSHNVAAGIDGTGGFGGGLWNDGVATLVDVAIEDNVAAATPLVGVSSGGGLWNNGFMRVARSTISGNRAMVGGGIYNGNVVRLDNVTLSGNVACCLGGDSRGGAIMNDANVVLRHTTVSSNTADGPGSGLFGSGLVSSSIIAENPPGSEPSSNCSGTMSSGGFNIDSDGTCRFANVGDQEIDPLLGPLQQNGGYGFTRALRTGSPAIDAGRENDCLALDQRGVTRPRDGNRDTLERCDVGAFESRGVGDGACIGDCDVNGTVWINEVVRGVNIVLSGTGLTDCFAADANADARVAIYEIVGAVDRLLRGCER